MTATGSADFDSNEWDASRSVILLTLPQELLGTAIGELRNSDATIKSIDNADGIASIEAELPTLNLDLLVQSLASLADDRAKLVRLR